MAPSDRPTVASPRVEVYRVPTDRPEADGTIAWDSTTAVVVEIEAGGEKGLGWTYSSGACRSVVEGPISSAVTGTDAMDVPGAHEAMVRACRNLGRPGVVSSAIAAVDTALWDLKARLLGASLSDLFGRCRDDVPVYGSGGFTTYDDETTASQLRGWVEDLAIPRVKIKIGESWGSQVTRDLSRVALSRRVIGDDAELYVDANGGYSVKQAVRTGRVMERDLGVVWLEEPVSSDDLAGLAEIRHHLGLDVAAGEYGYDEVYFQRMVAAGAVDCLQVDVTRCGGYTSWRRAAATAAAAGVEVSGHCCPSLHAHVAVSIPNLRHVEYFHDHQRLEPMLFDGVLTPRAGALWPDRSAAGHGMTLRRSDAEKYRVA